MGGLTRELKRFIPGKKSFVAKFSDNLNSNSFLKKAKINKENKKRVVRNKPKDNSSISREDFETFGIGIRRLRELRKELNSIDTRGFS
ncbi:MAG: hypothetical protein QF567_03080, partial [Candidatus Pacearchaeota archaeon]|nr:hypothetical protein [Candidatus Pacearchaeota archaeon]